MASQLPTTFGTLALPKGARSQSALQRYPHVDVFKSVGIFCVVLAHSFPMGAVLASGISSGVLGWVVPSFLACSGYVYARSAAAGCAGTLRRIGRILCPYACATACMWSLRAWQNFPAYPPLSVKQCAYELLMGDAATPYYFIFQLTVCIATTPLMAACSQKVLQALLLACVVLHIMWNSWLQAALGVPMRLGMHVPVSSWGFFVVGWLQTDHRLRRWHAVFIIIICIALEKEAYSVFTCLGLAYAVCELMPVLIPPDSTLPLNQLIVWVSNNTYTIMLYHVGFVEIAKRALGPDPHEFEMRVHFVPTRVVKIWVFATAMSSSLALIAPMLLGATWAKGIFGCLPQEPAEGEPGSGGPTAALLAKPKALASSASTTKGGCAETRSCCESTTAPQSSV